MSINMMAESLVFFFLLKLNYNTVKKHGNKCTYLPVQLNKLPFFSASASIVLINFGAFSLSPILRSIVIASSCFSFQFAKNFLNYNQQLNFLYPID